MHIENEVKYDFSDVLIKPKRSYYTSRKEVDLERKKGLFLQIGLVIALLVVLGAF